MRIIIVIIALVVFQCSPKKESIAKKPYIPVDAPVDIGFGVINTKVDGYDVKRVNLSKSPTDKSLICSLEQGVKIRIIQKVDEYYLVQSIDNQDCKGYCMIGFVEKQ